MEAKYTLIVDFARPQKTNTVIISEGDADSRVCEFHLLNDKQAFDMGDVASASVRGVRDDGSTIVGIAEIVKDEHDLNTNVVRYVIPASVSDIAGKVTITITLLALSGAVITSFEFYINIRNSLYNENDASFNEQDLSGIRDLLNRTKEYLDEMKAIAHVEELPNPFMLRIVIDGVEYTYTGRVETDIELGHIAYIDEGDPLHPEEDSIDETSAKICVDTLAKVEQKGADAQASYENAIDMYGQMVADGSELAEKVGEADRKMEVIEAEVTAAIVARQEAEAARDEAKDLVSDVWLNPYNVTATSDGAVVTFLKSSYDESKDYAFKLYCSDPASKIKTIEEESDRIIYETSAANNSTYKLRLSEIH